MRGRFPLFPRRPRSQPEASTATSARTRRKKRALKVALALLCLATPQAFFQIALYRQNLAMLGETLPNAPSLSARDRLLVLAPHCDDETLGAGGSIAAARRRGIPVRIVFLTNGDGSRSTQIALNLRKLRRHSFQQLATLRQQEALAAARALGVDEKNVVFLGYPDGGTKELWLRHWTPDNVYRSTFTGAERVPYATARTPEAPHCGQQALSDVAGALRDFRPTVVVTTHPHDTNPDHQAAYEFTAAALEQLRHQPQQTWSRRVRLLTFVVHHGVWPVPNGYRPALALAPPAALKNIGTRWMQQPLDDTAKSAKQTALECYPSQLATTPRYLRAFVRRNELFDNVPPQSAPRESARDVTRDPVRDALRHILLPAADLQSIAVLSHKNGVLTLRLQSARAPSSRLNYRLWLHAIGASQSKVSRLDIRWQSGAWRAVLSNEKGGRDLAVRGVTRGLEVDLPREKSNASLLISAESRLGTRRLDATATGTLQ